MALKCVEYSITNAIFGKSYTSILFCTQVSHSMLVPLAAADSFVSIAVFTLWTCTTNSREKATTEPGNSHNHMQQSVNRPNKQGRNSRRVQTELISEPVTELTTG